jgi:hypothetical protein
MKTYIINIPTREDRRLLCDTMLRENGFEIEEEGRKNEEGFIAPDLRVEFTTHWPYNKVGKDITDKWLEENGFGLFDWEMDEGEALSIDQSWAKWWSRPLTGGEIGCTLSHWSIWNECDGPVTILEDDAVFTKAMEIKRDVTIDTLETMGIDWDLLYLGRVPQTIPEEPIVSGIVKPNFSYKAIIPADEFLSATFVEHPRSDVSFKYPPTMNAYAVDPHVVWQREFAVVGSDTGLPDGAVK